METNENWLSPEGYSLSICRVNTHIITGNLKMCLNHNYLAIPLKGLINIGQSNQFEFCFMAEWYCDSSNNTYCSTFVGKHHFKQHIEYISLRWLFVSKSACSENQNHVSRGHKKFFKESGSINSQTFPSGLHIPYQVDIERKKGTEKVEKHRF